MGNKDSAKKGGKRSAIKGAVASAASAVGSVASGAADAVGSVTTGATKRVGAMLPSRSTAQQLSPEALIPTPWDHNWEYVLYLELLNHCIQESAFDKTTKEVLNHQMTGFKTIVEETRVSAEYVEAIQKAPNEKYEPLQENGLPSYGYIRDQVKSAKRDPALTAKILEKANRLHHEYLARYAKEKAKNDEDASVKVSIHKQARIQLPYELYRIEGKHYLAKTVLGAGVCGTASLGVELDGNQPKVVKVVRPMVGGPFGSIQMQTGKNETVVLQTLKQGGQMWDRKLGMDLMHPNKTWRALVMGNEVISIQDLQKGKPLGKVLNEVSSPREVAEIFKAIAEAMEFLHKNNVFHGDIKDENILYDPETKTANFIDFGLSCPTDGDGNVIKETAIFYNAPSQFFNKRQVTGLLHNESPEWKEGKPLSQKTDIFALGKVYEQIYKKTNCQDPELQKIVNSMQDKDPIRRPGLSFIKQQCDVVIDASPPKPRKPS